MINVTDGYVRKCGAVCALGLFDGVHRGHQMIIRTAVEQAKKSGCASAVFCFRTDTVSSKGHDGRLEMLMTDREKNSHIAGLGVDLLYSPDFEKLRSMPPEIFVRDVLADYLGCKSAVCGTDFTFGRGASGKADDLVRLGKKYGMEVSVMSQLTYEGGVISSTEIRRLIRSGEIEKANEMLGYRYGYTLKVEHGFEKGRTWNFPTINQKIPRGLVLPRFGVYCSQVEIDGRLFAGVTNIGIKPTIHIKTAPLAETYILDYDGDLYGRELALTLHKFVRPERTFENVTALREEIARNTEYTREYFQTNSGKECF